MGKYIKYEIKGSYRFILGVLALVLLLTTGIFAYATNIKEGYALGGVFIGLSTLVILGTLFGTFLYIVGSFRKELYEDRGYLTFTLPLTGNQILGGKLIVATIWFVLLGAVLLGYNFLLAMGFTPLKTDILKIIPMITTNSKLAIGFIISLILGINTLILIYFSMALGRVTFKNKKIGGFWFLIFLGLSSLIMWGQVKTIQLLPYYLDLTSFKLVSSNIVNQISGNINIIQFNDSTLLLGNGDTTIINIFGFLYTIVMGVVTFLGTGYLVENKIDL